MPSKTMFISPCCPNQICTAAFTSSLLSNLSPRRAISYNRTSENLLTQGFGSRINHAIEYDIGHV